MRFYWQFTTASFLLLVTPVWGEEFSRDQLCEAVFREYGMRTEFCEDNRVSSRENRPPLAPSAGELPPETMESHVFFLSGGASLSQKSREKLSRMSAVLNNPMMRRACVQLVGHSDASGGSAVNLALSARRAEAVAAELRKQLQNGSRIEVVKGAGESQPLPGISPESPFNRRVAVWARDCAIPAAPVFLATDGG